MQDRMCAGLHLKRFGSELYSNIGKQTDPYSHRIIEGPFRAAIEKKILESYLRATASSRPFGIR